MGAIVAAFVSHGRVRLHRSSESKGEDNRCIRRSVGIIRYEVKSDRGIDLNACSRVCRGSTGGRPRKLSIVNSDPASRRCRGTGGGAQR
jgi:hypothetical protein